MTLSQQVPYFDPTVVVYARTVSRAAAPVMETLEDLKALAPKLNPVIGYWNPLGLGEPIENGSGEEQTFAVGDSEAAIGFIRHSEIKHGRVAMAAFIGFIVGENNIFFPGALQGDGLLFADISSSGGACAQWDALPTAAKLQILLFIGALEFWGELDGQHYMRGGQPGKYPSFDNLRKDLNVGSNIVKLVPALDLFDPFKLSEKASAEKKERGLLAEINNGRLAQLGIMGFVSAASVDGSVPSLTGMIKHYDGNVMAPFSAVDSGLPFVKEMLTYPSFPLPGFLIPGM